MQRKLFNTEQGPKLSSAMPAREKCKYLNQSWFSHVMMYGHKGWPERFVGWNSNK